MGKAMNVIASSQYDNLDEASQALWKATLATTPMRLFR